MNSPIRPTETGRSGFFAQVVAGCAALAGLLLLGGTPAGAFPTGDTSALGTVLTGIYQNLQSSVVPVVSYRPTGPWLSPSADRGRLSRLEPSRGMLWSSGVVLDTEGRVLTCCEGAQPGDSLEVGLPQGGRSGARFLAQDVAAGVALIQVLNPKGLVPLRIPSNSTYHQGDWVLVFHYDGADGRPQLKLATLDRTIADPAGRVSSLTVDLGACAGTCGGAVVDGKGQFRGMVVDVRVRGEPSLGDLPPEVAALLDHDRVRALPATQLTEFAAHLLEKSLTPNGFLGVRPALGGDAAETDPNGENAASIRGPIRVVEVLPGSPAEAAGILPGDRILSIEGQSLTEVSEVSGRIAAFRPGSEVHLGILRNGVPLSVIARVGDRSSLDWLEWQQEMDRRMEKRLRRSLQALEGRLRILEDQRARSEDASNRP